MGLALMKRSRRRPCPPLAGSVLPGRGVEIAAGRRVPRTGHVLADLCRVQRAQRAVGGVPSAGQQLAPAGRVLGRTRHTRAGWPQPCPICVYFGRGPPRPAHVRERRRAVDEVADLGQQRAEAGDVGGLDQRWSSRWTQLAPRRWHAAGQQRGPSGSAFRRMETAAM